MFDHIKLSFQSIFAHKMRSILTMLGVIIGIAAIIAIVSMIEGQKESLKSEMIGTGNNSITVMFQSDNQSGMPGEYIGEVVEDPPPNALPPITKERLEEAASMDFVKNVAVFYQNYAQVFHLNNFSDTEIYAMDENYLSSFPIQILEGRKITRIEYDKGFQVTMINETTKNQLFPDGEAINQFIEVNSIPFRVIGVYKEKKKKEKNLMMTDFEQGKMLIPTKAWPYLGSFNDMPQIIVQANHSDELEAAGQSVATVLNEDIPEESTWHYSIPNLDDIMADLEEFNRAFSLLLGGIASISLLVGGIGVMNIMLVSVTERTREIGIKKALGAKRRIILAQFLTEAAVLTSIGGIIGILTGLGGAKAIAHFAHLPFAVPVPAVIGSVLFSMAVGIIFGLIPSLKAAKMKPIDALRYE
ncbi:putative ABC transport system permease protein [Oikeobacillus pervagus]|uniref:ABC transport system permease protein n=1 Tax=Oikeobacillus pervagus TaxID=1325931 RepID=A0AAJ1T075_9BACI|nr:ABC transporter permease [Oikeobacillus pervagus]MDQ0214917.1 putative ABC transport system permease protein [Oikeobacillus pervagus]